jgi:hypothetical protein
MPDDFQLDPESADRLRTYGVNVEAENVRRAEWLRSNGYRGPIDQDGRPAAEDGAAA